MDFCFICEVYTFISTGIGLCSMFTLEFWSSYFSEHLRLIAVPKSSQRRCSTKKAVLKKFAIFTRKHLCWSLWACNFIKKSFQHRCFPVNIAKFLRTPDLKNICERPLLCTCPVSPIIVFQINIELLLQFQLLLVRDILFCVICLDNKY